MPHARKIDVPLTDRLAFSMAEVSGLTGFSISYLYELIDRGVFRTKRVEGRRIATAGAIAELLGVTNLAEVLGRGAEASPEQPAAPVADTIEQPVATNRLSQSGAPPTLCTRLPVRRIKQEKEVS